MKASIIALSVSAGAGTVVGAGVLVSRVLLRESVSDILKQKGHTFINFEDNGDLTIWKEIAKAYASGKNKLGKLIIAKPVSTGEVSEDDAKKLRKICKDTVGSKSYTDTILLSAEQWCVKPITIKELINSKRNVLNLDASNTDLNKSEWTVKVGDYLKDNATDKIPNTTLTDTTKSTTEENIKKLKADCNTLTTKNTHDVDFHDNYKQFEKWCTIPK